MNQLTAYNLNLTTVLYQIALIKMESFCYSIYNHSIRVHRILHRATYLHSLGWIGFIPLGMSTFPCLSSLWPLFGSCSWPLFFSVGSFFFVISRFFSSWIRLLFGFLCLWTLRCWCLLLLLNNKSKKFSFKSLFTQKFLSLFNFHCTHPDRQ